MSIKVVNRPAFIPAVVVALLLLAPGLALADMEFYTYGGFSDVVGAFTKCALIFSDNKYMALAGTVFVAMFAWNLARGTMAKLL